MSIKITCDSAVEHDLLQINDERYLRNYKGLHMEKLSGDR
jgi:hypothetical protein